MSHPHAIEDLVRHLEHVLPGQASIKDFVHHNTLHGFQRLPFPEALAAAKRVTGIHGFLPTERFRAFFQEGRIGAAELDASLAEEPGLDCTAPAGPFRRLEVYRAALLHDFPAVTPCQLAWQADELDALATFQADVPRESRERLLREAGTGEAEAVADLWQACLEVLGLEQEATHVEELLDLSPEHAERLVGAIGLEEEAEQLRTHRLLKHEADRLLADLLDQVGPRTTLRGLLLTVTGRDILAELRPLLLRHLASYMDLGLAAWHSPDRAQGFYAAWRASALADPAYLIEDFPNWRDEIEALPESAVAAVAEELGLLGLEEEKRADYLERLALELPGWSGMVMWRHLRPGYGGAEAGRVEMMDYLAVRLVLERLFAARVCRAEFRVEPRLDMLRWHFKRRRPELLARWMLFNARLPEYLANRAQRLLHGSREAPADDEDWLVLAHRIWTWRIAQGAHHQPGRGIHDGAWRLFRLAQHLGLRGGELRAGGRDLAEALLACLEALDDDKAGHVWLRAYEAHYRDQILGAIVRNHGRGRWAKRETRPAAQMIFCMDDREEGIRRHLEEINPAVETLGAAGFFGVPINWRGLDDEAVSPLCPIVVTPSNEIRELPIPEAAPVANTHAKRRERRLALKDLVYRGSHRGLLSPALLSLLAAPGALALLAGKLVAPLAVGRISESFREAFDLAVPTRLALDAPEDGRAATPQEPRQGFTDAEQANRVEGFLRMVGLTHGFAPFVVLMGHGSMSQNNPHLAAYDCGACSGRHGGPNARVFAAMANRPVLRAELARRGIAIPEDTWFLGAEHDTCDESILWYDLDRLPDPLRPAFEAMRRDLDLARAHSAHERARRLASAPRRPSLTQALAHMAGRGRDFSQARPELGHATNACAFIGRRSATQGAFFDRRMFLISYDPTQDPEGRIVEAILLAAGPVGAGISLEYYFSTVDNDRFGCGTKVAHNVTGFLGVMEGASSDLRTGLPRQMIEIHEAMRLLVIVEHKTEVLTRIYQEQEIVRELVANAWIQLAAKDPDSAAIHLFKPGLGWVAWHGTDAPLPLVKRSADWYSGHTEPLPPALVEQPGEDAHA